MLRVLHDEQDGDAPAVAYWYRGRQWVYLLRGEIEVRSSGAASRVCVCASVSVSVSSLPSPCSVSPCLSQLKER